MAQGRGLLQEIFKNFIRSLKPRNTWGKLIGKDNLGTEYYEDTNPARGGRASRWFVPKDRESCDVEKPTEWETWLRHGRKHPPTEEEILLNFQKKMAAVENARKLEKSKHKPPDTLGTPKRGAFPVYEDYETNPNGKKI